MFIRDCRAIGIECPIIPGILPIQVETLFCCIYFGSFCCSDGMGARCISVVRVFAHGAMGRQIDPSWGGPIELFLVPANAPRLV